MACKLTARNEGGRVVTIEIYGTIDAATSGPRTPYTFVAPHLCDPLFQIPLGRLVGWRIYGIRPFSLAALRVIMFVLILTNVAVAFDSTLSLQFCP